MQQTNRELLALAAKAGSIVGHFENDGEDAGIFCDDPNNHSMWKRWNPLADDGDALRLAVKLKIIITFADGGAGPHVCAGRRLDPAFSNEPLAIVHFLDQHAKDLTATRRAITRAAAEIGKAMP